MTDFDEGRRTLRVVSCVLEPRAMHPEVEHVVARVIGLAAAQEAIAAHSPDVLVVALSETTPLPLEFPLPVVAYGPASIELAVLRGGADDFIANESLDVACLQARAELAVSRRARAFSHGLASARQHFSEELRAHSERTEREKRFLERERAGLRQQEVQLHTILGDTTDFVAAIGLDLHARYINPAGLELAGFDRDERVFGLSMLDLFPEAERRRFEQEVVPAVRSEGRWTGTLELRSHDGVHIHVDSVLICHLGDDDTPHFISVIARDITERRRIEEQLRKAQKNEAVGRLAGGVAHDFNNLLTAISSFARFALETVGPDHEVAEDMREILSASERAEELTRQLLAFSRRRTIAPRVLELNELVLDTERMLRRMVREDIEFSTKVASDTWNVRVDPGAFEQVLVNLCVNARDAMPDGGTLELEVANVVLEGNNALQAPTGDYVRVTVTDNGQGIPPEVLPRIFDPFFTTKEQGKGTGLGLSTCYGIITQAGGFIDAHSTLGSGSTFHVLLPRVRAPAQPARDSEQKFDTVSGGSEVVFIAEDNEQVRRLATRILERSGYRVFAAQNGAEALDQIERSALEVDLLLTDVVMPIMGGRQLARQIGELSPNTQVLFMSGFAEHEIVAGGEIEEGVSLLSKPFAPDELLERVRQVLNAPAQKPG